MYSLSKEVIKMIRTVRRRSGSSKRSSMNLRGKFKKRSPFYLGSSASKRGKTSTKQSRSVLKKSLVSSKKKVVSGRKGLSKKKSQSGLGLAAFNRRALSLNKSVLELQRKKKTIQSLVSKYHKKNKQLWDLCRKLKLSNNYSIKMIGSLESSLKGKTKVQRESFIKTSKFKNQRVGIQKHHTQFKSHFSKIRKWEQDCKKMNEKIYQEMNKYGLFFDKLYGKWIALFKDYEKNEGCSIKLCNLHKKVYECYIEGSLTNYDFFR